MTILARTHLMILGVGLLSAAATSLAAEIKGTVTPLSETVSLAVDRSAPVATYEVTLTNLNTVKALDNARFVATATVCSSFGSEGQCIGETISVTSAKFGNGLPVPCPLTSDSKTFDCSIGSLAPYQTAGDSKTFLLTFRSPTSGLRIDLRWYAVFDYGAPPGGGNGNDGTTPIFLAAPNPDLVTSAVPANSDELDVFTGYFAIPSENDKVTTAINVPKGLAVSSKAAVTETPWAEDDRDCKSQRNFNRCYRTEISIPDVKFTKTEFENDGKKFAFKLRVDKSNIKNGAKIDKVVIRYDPDGPDGPLFGPSQLQFCEIKNGEPVPNTYTPTPYDSTNPSAIYVPCIAKANDYSKKGDTTSTGEKWFGFEWIIYNLSNGFFDLL